ncbi:MAG: hypothetical protein GY797_16850 [Deltaproteobacteria bacterium]|nr:hypothetical protein [Deltaproteobacteria bacterium]
MGNKYLIKITSGFFLGSICGIISIPVPVGAFVGYSSLTKGISVLDTVAEVILVSFIAMLVFGLTAANIGAVVGTINGATNGGIGTGIEWVFIIGCASVLGAWLWQIDVDSYFWFGVFGGIIGGIVGWSTWFFSRIKGKKKKLTAVMLIGYLFAFTYIAVVNPIITEIMLVSMID